MQELVDGEEEEKNLCLNIRQAKINLNASLVRRAWQFGGLINLAPEVS